MVQNPRAAPGPGHLRPLNQPVPVRVKESPRRHPVSLVLNGRVIPLASLADTWEIADEWWRGQPISRRYYRVVTREGRHLTLFRDLNDGQWYQQQS